MTTATYNAALDRYVGAADPVAPSRFASPITPSDTAAVAIGPEGVYAKRLWIGTTGNVALITAGDNSNNGLGTVVTYNSVPAGAYLNVQVRQVMATNTTASNIVGEAD